MLVTLWEHTEPGAHKVIIINQTGEPLPEFISANVDVVVTPKRNLGFAKAMNTGIRMATTPYVTYANDDIVFLDKRWWDGIKDTFAKTEQMLAVNPLSPKEPGWGYGSNTPDWGERDGDFIYPGGTGWRKPEDVDYDWLMTKYKKGWIEGLAGWCVTLKMDRLQAFLDSETNNPYRLVFDERFYPGSGEDYDLCHRIYGKGYKAVATCSSWVWHHWGKSQAFVQLKPGIVDDKRRWNKLQELYVDNEEHGWKSPIYQRKRMRIGLVEPVDY